MEREYTGLLEDGAVVRLSIESDGIRGQIDRYRAPDPRLIFQASPIPSILTLKVGGGEIASLNGLVPVATKRRADHEQQTFRATSLVLGPASFLGTEKISGIRFVPTNQRHAIYWTAHRISGSVAALSEPLTTIDTPGAIFGRYQVDAIDGERLEAVRVVEQNVSIVMDVKFTENHNRQGTQRSEQRWVSIGYVNGRTLDEAVGDIQYICAFMSTMLGLVIAPTELDFEVCDPIARSGERYRMHSHFRAPAPEMKITDLNTGLVSANYNRSRYETALRAWLTRRAEWQQATAFALEALTMRNRLDRVRFLNATSWFEAIPDGYMPTGSVIAKTDLDAAAGAATALLTERGHTIVGNRVRGLLGNLNSPSLAMRLQGAVASLRTRYSANVLPANAEDVCRLIPAIRGSYAHGDDPLLGRHAGTVLESTILTETICYLLTIADLGFELEPNLGAEHVLTGSLQRLDLLAQASAAKSASGSAGRA